MREVAFHVTYFLKPVYPAILVSTHFQLGICSNSFRVKMQAQFFYINGQSKSLLFLAPRILSCQFNRSSKIFSRFDKNCTV